MTTLRASRKKLLIENENKQNFEISSESEDGENEIPYHAREYAKPFTYESTNGITVSTYPPPSPPLQKRELKQISFEEMHEFSKVSKANQPNLPPSPSVVRKLARPSISPSRPVLRKTPSRQEFEEMLRERREQSMREQNLALKEAQNAAIQKDLDELQEKLNFRVLQLESFDVPDGYKENTCREIVKHVETIDLPDEKIIDNNNTFLTDIVEDNNKYELAITLAEPVRPDTPAFPFLPKNALEERCVSPYPMVTHGSPSMQRTKNNVLNAKERKSPGTFSTSQQDKITEKCLTEVPRNVAPHLVKFARDCSEYWYKPYMTRDEAVKLLRKAAPGTFIIRNSTTYKNAFGLVLRVSKPPQGITLPESGDNNEVLVRHFLLEPTTRGVRIKGCSNEPTFTSLSALVYQHSINELALPCKLIIPTYDLMHSSEDIELIQIQKQLLEQGAACNVLYLFSMNTESLTGDEAIRKSVSEMYAQPVLSPACEVHFKVSQNGITLTDKKRQKFFRRHYSPKNISHIAMDPDDRLFTVQVFDNGIEKTVNKSIFAFVARSSAGSRDNQCHIFCDLVATQPAVAIISFAHKVLNLNKNNYQML